MSSPMPGQQQQQQQQTFSPPSNLDNQNTKDLVAKIITSIVFVHYTESQMPGSFQSTIDAMFKRKRTNTQGAKGV